ncbi:DUF1553 domain-containing protein [Akkermansiaceae bacterium]|nr:DUF1553 domain-containing protein [Akkermansiaceae bacterium]MDA7868361.1 DUF1553 domain-containing protein [bacterium]MDA7896051.1 DUF1553 domain-containing protein [bacterium]MDA7907523.1 DUF1553 domain-containing protein [Akkermansiaceae bacterium]MDA7933962.1 DUF1553 domain-containing protein [Akkermansiaceae bacterium]
MKGLLPAAFLVGSLSAGTIDFNRDVRPILSDTCFKCHGPGETKGDLRLDDREDALDAGVLSPGDVARSEIVKRLKSHDPEELMPPPEANKTLTPKQIQTLETWIAEGAEYDDHWSLVPPKRDAGVKSLDHFIDKRIKEAGLESQPEADRRTQIRRVTLDLTGLPPTPEEVEDFIADKSPDAYEKLVDRLLASDAYGERMAVAWMDAARYGDTSVMHADGPRDMWPWRDWVIKAYNSNMPFDQFTVEQIAGDLIPEATVSQKVASGFNRNHATSDEGGAFAEELRVEYVADRVQTTANVWMGLTMECAQCHDHKYDPISQKEYYQFFAFFNNTTDPGMQTRNGNQAPVVEVPDEERMKRLAGLDQQLTASDEKIEGYRNLVARSPEFQKWVAKKSEEARKNGSTKQPDGLIHWFPINEAANDFRDEITGSAAVAEKGKFEVSDRGKSKALKLNGRTQFKFDTSVHVEFDRPFSITGWVKPNGNAAGAILSKMDDKAGFRGFDLWMEGGRIGTHIVNTWQSNALKVVTKEMLKPNQWHHVVLTYDGTHKASGVKIFIDGKLATNQVQADTLQATIKTSQPLRIGGRSTSSIWKGEVDDLRLYGRALRQDELAAAGGGDPVQNILATPAKDRKPGDQQILLARYLGSQDKTYKNLVSAKQKLEKQRADLDRKPVTSMIMQDNPPDKMRKTYVLDRGAYDSPKKDEVITPAVPKALPAMPEGAPANRLGLAKWLTQPDHPLTARVAVNRYWMMLFGEGLVRSVGDFGAQSTPPTHPELLDWLAVDFVESGWNVKRMLKQIVMSKTYRKSSKIESMHREKDSENELLARAPRFRLQGEFIRDHALAVSGLLNPEIGGPGVKPYQPANIWNEVSLNGGLRYRQDKGDKLYRRSMYTYWKRSSPMPNMLIFDSPSREKCVIQRQRTNTPLQALVTLNDPQFLEAARAFAERLLKSDKGSTADRIDLAYRYATARPASGREVEVLTALYQKNLERFKAAPETAKDFLMVGESPRDDSLDAPEHAAWMVVAQTIMNLDESLTRN